jgi:hypothetical protein
MKTTRIFSIGMIFFFVCLTLFSGCAGQEKVKTQNKLNAMSDKELIDHYEMLEMLLTDIDRDRDSHLELERDIYERHYPKDYQNHLGNLHIGDRWYQLKKEKELTLVEMNSRGISLP